MPCLHSYCFRFAFKIFKFIYDNLVMTFISFLENKFLSFEWDLKILENQMYFT